MAGPCGRLDLAHVLAEMPAVLDLGGVCAEDWIARAGLGCLAGPCCGGLGRSAGTTCDYGYMYAGTVPAITATKNITRSWCTRR